MLEYVEIEEIIIFSLIFGFLVYILINAKKVRMYLIVRYIKNNPNLNQPQEIMQFLQQSNSVDALTQLTEQQQQEILMKCMQNGMNSSPQLTEQQQQQQFMMKSMQNGMNGSPQLTQQQQQEFMMKFMQNGMNGISTELTEQQKFDLQQQIGGGNSYIEQRADNVTNSNQIKPLEYPQFSNQYSSLPTYGGNSNP
jgi:hypothetical protein